VVAYALFDCRTMNFSIAKQNSLPFQHNSMPIKHGQYRAMHYVDPNITHQPGTPVQRSLPTAATTAISFTKRFPCSFIHVPP